MAVPATVATVIASPAIITCAYSLTRQASGLDRIPATSCSTAQRATTAARCKGTRDLTGRFGLAGGDAWVCS
jgi:hypothetical protein